MKLPGHATRRRQVGLFVAKRVKKRPRGRPPKDKVDSNLNVTPKTAPEATVATRPKRNPGLPQRYKDNDVFLIAEEETSDVFIICSGYALIVRKERDDQALALRLRAEGKITTPGLPFAESDRAELDGLMGAEVLQPVLYDAKKHAGARIFKSRMVREIKDRHTDSPREKSRL